MNRYERYYRKALTDILELEVNEVYDPVSTIREIAREALQVDRTDLIRCPPGGMTIRDVLREEQV